MITLAHQENSCVLFIWWGACCKHSCKIMSFLHVIWRKTKFFVCWWWQGKCVKPRASCSLLYSDYLLGVCSCFANINWSWHKERKLEVLLMDKGLEKSRNCLNRAKNYPCHSQTRKTLMYVFHLKCANITWKGRIWLQMQSCLKTFWNWVCRSWTFLVSSLKQQA